MVGTVTGIVTGDAPLHSLAQSPTQLVTSRKTASAMDARGRQITVLPLNALEHYRLAEIGSSSGSATAANYEIMASSVCEIDGQQVPRPVTKMQLEAMIQRLDFDGIEAVAKALKECADKEDVASAKKSVAIQASG